MSQAQESAFSCFLGTDLLKFSVVFATKQNWRNGAGRLGCPRG